MNNATAQGTKQQTIEEKLINLKAAYEAGGPSALIEGCSRLTNHIRFAALWSWAMTEKYGSVGLHKSWTNEDGTPTVEALAQFPRLRESMNEARERIVATWTFIGSESPWLKDIAR